MNVESAVALGVPLVVGVTLIFGRASFARWRYAREDRRKVRELRAFHRARHLREEEDEAARLDV